MSPQDTVAVLASSDARWGQGRPQVGKTMHRDRSGGEKPEVEAAVATRHSHQHICYVCHAKFRTKATTNLFCLVCARGPLCTRCRNSDRPSYIGAEKARATRKMRAAMCMPCDPRPRGVHLRWWYTKGGSRVRKWRSRTCVRQQLRLGNC